MLLFDLELIDYARRWRKIYGLRLGLADTWQGWVDQESYVF